MLPTLSRIVIALTIMIPVHAAYAQPVPLKGDFSMDAPQQGIWRFEHEMGHRIEANVTHWLLRTPGANPGLLEMFYRRDRHLPYNEPVPWAGEFAGKYLISAVQACYMSENQQLRPLVQAFVDRLVDSQAEDGYLGPWPKKERLLGHWDLWGHYHCTLGLLLWFDLTGDQQAYDCAIRAADCICDIYAEGDRRPIDAGTPQINLAILHSMALLYERTGNERYMALMKRVEEDMQQDGDWLRKGVEGVPYCQLPGGGTRWESLHIVQGLAELYRITGDEQYKKAVVSLWESIREYDRHPSGAFSTHECAYGTIYAAGSIETCCSVAWLALSVDVLRLTGDPAVADEIELTTWNQVLAAQHPSGNWCTYDNPINGVRAPSYHQIHFQYRPGTPELNCCSVNAPRGTGMLKDWALMEDEAGLVINYYGPCRTDIEMAGGRQVSIEQETEYPVSGNIRMRLELEEEAAFAVKLRIPAWSKETGVEVNGEPVDAIPEAGAYLVVDRTWKKGDRIEIKFDMTPRSWVGQGPDRGGQAALFAGPLLLTFDAYFNDIETADLKAIDMEALALEPVDVDRERRLGYFPPMGLWKVKTVEEQEVLLCDFGSAGAHGTDFAAWLPAANVPPPAVTLKTPAQDAQGAPGPVMFRWETAGDYAYELLVAKDPEFKDLVTRVEGIQSGYAVVEEGFGKEGTYYWKVATVNDAGSTENRDGARALRVVAGQPPFYALREDGLMVASALDGDGEPSFGGITFQDGLAAAPGRKGDANGAVAFAGNATKLRYKVPFFPERDYTFLAWVCPGQIPTAKGLQQIFSAWCRGLDDPLRVAIDDDKLYARIEAQGMFGTDGVVVEQGKWIHVAAVKEGPKLTVYVNGEAAASADVPEVINSACEEVGIGFNPLYAGGEHFTGAIDDFAFYARALTPEEVKKAAE